MTSVNNDVIATAIKVVEGKITTARLVHKQLAKDNPGNPSVDALARDIEELERTTTVLKKHHGTF